MSVIVLIRFKTDAETLERVAGEQADVVRRIAENARSRGALHHCFVEADGEVMVIDEWETADAFQAFFEGNEEIPGVLAAAGVAGPPEITVHRKLDTPDIF